MDNDGALENRVSWHGCAEVIPPGRYRLNYESPIVSRRHALQEDSIADGDDRARDWSITHRNEAVERCLWLRTRSRDRENAAENKLK